MNDTRQRAFSYLIRTYDEIRRAVLFVRWYEADGDTYAPSLYAKSRKSSRSPEATPDKGDEEEDTEGGDTPPDVEPS